MRVKICKESNEVDIHPYCKWDQAKNSGSSCQYNWRNPDLATLDDSILCFKSALFLNITEFYDKDPVPDYDPTQCYDTQSGHCDRYRHLEDDDTQQHSNDGEENL